MCDKSSDGIVNILSNILIKRGKLRKSFRPSSEFFKMTMRILEAPCILKAERFLELNECRLDTTNKFVAVHMIGIISLKHTESRKLDLNIGHVDIPKIMIRKDAPAELYINQRDLLLDIVLDLVVGVDDRLSNNFDTDIATKISKELGPFFDAFHIRRITTDFPTQLIQLALQLPRKSQT